MSYAIFKRILDDFKAFLGPGKYYFAIFFGIAISIFSISEPFIYARTISTIEDFYKTGVFDTSNFLKYIGIWIGFILLSIIGNFYYRYSLIVVSVLNFYSFVFQKYAQKTLEISYNTYLGRKQGEIFKRFDTGTDNIFWFLMELFQEFIKTFSGIFFVLLIMPFIDWRMFLAFSSMIPVVFLVGYYTNSKTSPQQRKLDDEYNAVFGNVADSLTNLALVKTLSLEKILGKNIKKDFLNIISRQYNLSMKWSLAGVSTNIILMLGRLILIVVGIYLISQKTLSLADFLLFFFFVGWVYFPLTGFFERLRSLQKQLVAIEKFYTAFDEFEYEQDSSAGIKLEKVQGDIEFRDVSFGYRKEAQVLHNINFKIKKGQKVALVGNTGSGKSTIVNLIFRLWEHNQGEILLDGINIEKIDKKSLRKHIGMVMQDNTLFNTTIEENLKFAKPDATTVDILEALKKAKANFVLDLKDGIKTVIGERGLKLSGGEKQRINIARLILKNPEIIVLDEATSALDNSTEREVQAALEKMMHTKTSIIIAHRLSTIKHADIILVLENGKIIESGNYNELIKKNGKFFKLANPDKLII